METKRNIFIAFILNLLFSIFELFGGIFTKRVAIISDAMHDFGDAISIGVSFFLEVKSDKKPDKKYTYGYARFSVLGGLITTLILLISSGIVLYNAVFRIINPVKININGMLIFALVGLVVNLVATYFTHGGKSINQKAVNLHMLEDVLGWFIVLIGAIVIRFTQFYIIDPILSIIVAIFIIINSIKNLKQIMCIFLIKTPQNIDIDKILDDIKGIDGVIDVHHIHVWSIDGEINCATLHIVVQTFDSKIKSNAKEKMNKYGISHTTIEMEITIDECAQKSCDIRKTNDCYHHHHTHHHHIH